MLKPSFNLQKRPWTALERICMVVLRSASACAVLGHRRGVLMTCWLYGFSGPNPNTNLKVHSRHYNGMAETKSLFHLTCCAGHAYKNHEKRRRAQALQYHAERHARAGPLWHLAIKLLK